MNYSPPPNPPSQAQLALPRPVTRPAGRAVGRYAPSPTGDLHLGNLRTALAAWTDCRRRGGTFILRIEDLDTPRTVPGAEARMLEDLRWLGMDWDEGPDVGGPAGPYRQSERGPMYDAALTALEGAGLTYLCTCSRKELKDLAQVAQSPPAEILNDVDDNVASAPHGRDMVYPGTCRTRPPAGQRAHPAGVSVRFCVDDEPQVDFEDLCLGPQRFDLRTLCGDFIIRRRDGLWAYQLACALDDALMGVTHVLRGGDLLTSTPRQIALIRAIGRAIGQTGDCDGNYRIPIYGHLPLVLDEAGGRMCKRDGSCSLRSLRAAGMTPAQVRDLLDRLPLSG